MPQSSQLRTEHTEWIDSGYYQKFLGQMQQDGKGRAMTFGHHPNSY